MAATAHETAGVERVENAAKPIQEPESTGGQRILGQTCWWRKFGNVADVQNAANTPGVEQGVLAASRLSQFSGTI